MTDCYISCGVTQIVDHPTVLLAPWAADVQAHIPGINRENAMGYVIELKSETLYVTAVDIFWKGKPRRMTIESRPEYAVIQLSGIDEKFPVPWDEVFRAANARQEMNLRLELQAELRAQRPNRSSKKG
jgi:hypothetical protein